MIKNIVLQLDFANVISRLIPSWLIGNRPMSDGKRKTPFDVMTDRMDQAINAKRHQTEEVLREVERNFQTSIKGHIEYHRYLMEEARQRDDLSSMIHHRVLMETYEGILKNYSMSNSYNNGQK